MLVNGVTVVLVILPLVLIGAAAAAAYVSIRNSTLRITADGVEVANHRQPVRAVPLVDAERFEERPHVGFLSSLAPSAAVLVLTDGRRIPVRSTTDVESGAHGIDALNARLHELSS